MSRNDCISDAKSASYCTILFNLSAIFCTQRGDWGIDGGPNRDRFGEKLSASNWAKLEAKQSMVFIYSYQYSSERENITVQCTLNKIFSVLFHIYIYVVISIVAREKTLL